jgi:transposase, IS5 family
LPVSQTEDFFHGRLDQMNDLRHPLAGLSTHMPWQEIEASLAGVIARKVKAGKKVEDPQTTFLVSGATSGMRGPLGSLRLVRRGRFKPMSL